MISFSITPSKEDIDNVALIEAKKFDYDDIHNKCKQFAESFVNVYPTKYRLARGYKIIGLDKVEHWWCVDIQTGVIFDPTIEQFKGLEGTYVEIPDSRCQKCGRFTYYSTLCNSCENKI